ncbi:hypothetical protein Taro_050491 [Colocasia esculenta]|uniref:Retrotransposon gag domain-containing protein n=1 Tax=Colocasia esculenta TaxID=4460 RepID=A0A843XDK7_COLES|nr:hypothetical protein [Colocasia esculenta]
MQQTIQQLTQALLEDAGARGNQGAGDLHRNFRNLNPPQRDARVWWESVEATKADAQFTWAEFKEHFNSKYFSERIQERKASEFAALKQRHLTVAEYEAQFSRLACYANHLVNTEKMKARQFLNGLKPSYITQLAPLDIQTYVEMVKKAQLLEDANDLTDRIKGRLVKKEPASGACLRCRKRNHRILECPVLKEQEKEKRPNGQKKPGRLQAVQEVEPIEEGGFVECHAIVFWQPALADLSRPVQYSVAFSSDPVATLTGVRPRMTLTLKRTGTTKSEVMSTLAS